MAVAPNDAMAGHDQRNRIPAIGRPHRAHRQGIADRIRDILISRRPPIGHGQQLPPHLPLKVGSIQPQRQIKLAALAAHVLVDLAHALAHNGV